jgi:uncharacterized YccA/Bax inhibitor family protein
MKTIDLFFSGIIISAIVAVIVSKSSVSATAISSVLGAVAGLIVYVMSPLETKQSNAPSVGYTPLGLGPLGSTTFTGN